MQTSNRSEVALLRQQIEDEYRSAQLAMEGPVHVGSHDFINARMEGMWDSMEKLMRIVGKEAAAHIFMELR